MKLPRRRPQATEPQRIEVAGIEFPATSIPSRLEIHHTVKHEPKPKPHRIQAIIEDGLGYLWVGKSYYFSNGSGVGRLNLPGDRVFIKNEKGEYIPLFELKIEYWWNT
jgi:hypothetical protein